MTLDFEKSLTGSMWLWEVCVHPMCGILNDVFKGISYIYTTPTCVCVFHIVLSSLGKYVSATFFLTN